MSLSVGKNENENYSRAAKHAIVPSHGPWYYHREDGREGTVWIQRSATLFEHAKDSRQVLLERWVNTPVSLGAVADTESG